MKKTLIALNDLKKKGIIVDYAIGGGMGAVCYKEMIPFLAAVLQKKSDFRRQQAKLPFERKIEIVVRLQHLVAEIGKISGKKPLGKAWRPGKPQVSKTKGTRVSNHAARY